MLIYKFVLYSRMINVYVVLIIIFGAFMYRQPNPDRTVLIYTTHIDDDNQHKRVSELSETFASDFIVVWDNKFIPKCPFRGVTCIDNIPISQDPSKYDMAHAGHGNEKAMTWAIRNRATFKRVWFIEEDVYYTHMSILKGIVQFNYTQDFVTQTPGQNIPKTGHPRVPMSSKILKQWRAFDSKVVPKSVLLHFWSASRQMLDKLEQIYIRNNNTWMFFEGLIPTTADYFNLSTLQWPTYFDHLKIQMRFRPCVIEFPKPGIYHPVKHRHGWFTECKSKPPMRPPWRPGTPVNGLTTSLLSAASNLNVSLTNMFSKCGSDTCTHDKFCERGKCVHFLLSTPPKKLLANLTWLVSYPKSGSTWMRHLISNTYRYMTGDKNRPSSFSEVDALIPFDNIKSEINIIETHQAFINRNGYKKYKNPMEFKRVIHLIRDYRPTMVSYWHFEKDLGFIPRNMSFRQFINNKILSKTELTWQDFIRSWMSAYPNIDILWIKYEDLKKSPEIMLKRILTFLGGPFKNTPPEAISWAINVSSKKSMRESEKKCGVGHFNTYQNRIKNFSMINFEKNNWQSEWATVPLNITTGFESIHKLLY